MTYKEKVIDLLKRMMADTKKKRDYLERYECSEDVKRLDGGLNFANNYLVALTSIKEDPVPEKIGNKPEGFVVEGKTITINKPPVNDQPQFNLGVDESNVFNEPAESEDERIRKDIIALIKFSLKDGSAVSPGSNTTKEEALAYLEKLKEQKPNFDTHWENGSIVCEQKKQKPAEWSEEDWKTLDEMREHLICVVGDKPDFTPNKIYESFINLIDKLKSLRPSWKPSEEQKEALDKAIPVCMGVVGRDEVAPLESLYEQLKKL